MTDRTKKIALITGASAGLGREFARLFAADGHDVILVARRKDRLEQVAADVRKSGVQAYVISQDLSNAAAPQQIADEVAELDLQVEFLVNNAGFGSNGAFVDLEISREIDMVSVNICALMQLTHIFLPAMLARNSGRILNIGSTAGFQAGPYMATYYASKAFVNHFSEALAHELVDTGVTVTAHCPGATETEFGGVSGNGKTLLFARGVAGAADVAKDAYQAMHAGSPLAIHGLKNRLLVQSLRVSPRRLVTKITARLNQK